MARNGKCIWGKKDKSGARLEFTRISALAYRGALLGLPILSARMI
jgi:hypothetical protein